MSDPANPAPELEKSDNRLPAPVRFILKFIMYLGVAAVVFWVAMSLLLNYFLKDSFEMYISGLVAQPTRIHGGITLGTDFAKPSIVVSGIEVQKTPLDPASSTFTISTFEAGLPWQTVKEGQEKMLAFFIRIEDLTRDGKPYGSFEMPVTPLDNGDFEIKGIKGGLKDATFEGDLVKHGPRLDFTGKAKGIDYGQVAEGASGGKMDIDIALNAAVSDDMTAIVPHVNGTVFISGGEGKVAGNSVSFWSGSVAKAALEGAQETRINCTVGDLVVENGVVKPRALLIDTADATIYGQGYIDFTKQYADMVFTPRPKSGTGGMLTVPLNISGPFTGLSTSPDPVAVAAKLAIMVMGIPSAAMQPLDPARAGENACLTYVKGRTP